MRCGYNAACSNTVTVEADTLEEALGKAVVAVNEDAERWCSTDHCSDTYVEAVCEGVGDPWGEGSLPVPDRFSEQGEPPTVTLTGSVPPCAVEVTGGRVDGGSARVRILDA